MISSLKKLVHIFGPRERRNAGALFLLMLVAALLEVVGIAAVPAFVSAVASPGALADIPLVGRVAGMIEALDPSTAILWGSFGLIAIFALKNAFLILNFYLQVRFITNRRIELANRLTDAYMRAPYTFHLTRNTAELLRNVDREASTIAYAVLGPLLEVCTRLIIMVAVLAFLFVAEPWITLYWSAIFVVIAVVGVGLVSARLQQSGREEQHQRKLFVQALYQGFGTIKEARVLNRESFFRDNVDRSVRSMAAVARFKLFTGKVISPVTEFVAVSGLLGLAAGLVALGRPTESILVTLSLFVVGLVRLRETLNASMLHLANLRYNLVSVEPVYEDLAKLEARGRPLDAPAVPAPAGRFLRGAIELRDVWYRYDSGDDYSLRAIDLTIPAGAAVGLVGSTGAGKSTLMDIILGLIEPASGSVHVDGADIHQIGVANWQRRIGYVPQTIYLLDDTIRRNIALGLPDDEIDEGRVAEAVRKAQLDRFLDRQPQGLDTEVGEQGVRISGGERQRIGIARALYHDPEVLVLDEATSALDNETERAVIAAVEASRGQRTIIMIAHRLSTVRNCSQLYHLKDGCIVAQGSYDELKRRSVEFRQMAEGDAA